MLTCTGITRPVHSIVFICVCICIETQSLVCNARRQHYHCRSCVLLHRVPCTRLPGATKSASDHSCIMCLMRLFVDERYNNYQECAQATFATTNMAATCRLSNPPVFEWRVPGLQLLVTDVCLRVVVAAQEQFLKRLRTAEELQR